MHVAVITSRGPSSTEGKKMSEHGVGGWDEFHDAEIVDWKRVRSAIEHENELTNHRLTWMLNSQAFLFAAFALTFASSPESVGDLRGRQLPKCMQECDFCHIVRLESVGFFHRQFRLAIHALYTTC